jgi:hypothetical protein
MVVVVSSRLVADVPVVPDVHELTSTDTAKTRSDRESDGVISTWAKIRAFP